MRTSPCIIPHVCMHPSNSFTCFSLPLINSCALNTTHLISPFYLYSILFMCISLYSTHAHYIIYMCIFLHVLSSCAYFFPSNPHTCDVNSPISHSLPSHALSLIFSPTCACLPHSPSLAHALYLLLHLCALYFLTQ
jgi:hypothetical protein